MSKANIRKVGSIIVGVVISIIAGKVFWEYPLIIFALSSIVGLGLGMMRTQ